MCSLPGSGHTGDRALSFMFTTEQKPLCKAESNSTIPRLATIPVLFRIPMPIDISVTEVIQLRIDSLNYTLISTACKSN